MRYEEALANGNRDIFFMNLAFEEDEIITTVTSYGTAAKHWLWEIQLGLPQNFFLEPCTSAACTNIGEGERLDQPKFTEALETSGKEK